MDRRDIIPCIEVIEAKLGIEIVTAVEDGVDLGDGFVAVGFIASGHIAPCVVEVEHDCLTVGIGDRPHVVLRIFEVIICIAVVGEAEDIAGFIIHELEHVASGLLPHEHAAVVEILGCNGRIQPRILEYLLRPLAVDIVFVANIRRAVFPGTLQLSAVPEELNAVDICDIADLVALDRGRALRHRRIARLRTCRLRTECRSA